jgi:hypothetical protein
MIPGSPAQTATPRPVWSCLVYRHSLRPLCTENAINKWAHDTSCQSLPVTQLPVNNKVFYHRRRMSFFFGIMSLTSLICQLWSCQESSSPAPTLAQFILHNTQGTQPRWPLLTLWSNKGNAIVFGYFTILRSGQY